MRYVDPSEEWTAADELESLVGTASELDKFTAGIPLEIVQRIYRECLHISKELIEVCATTVIVHLPATEKAQVIEDELREHGLLEAVQISRRRHATHGQLYFNFQFPKE